MSSNPSEETARIAEIRELLMKLAEAAHRGGYCDADESKFTDEAAAEMWAMSESIHRRVESTLQDLLSRLSASPADVGPQAQGITAPTMADAAEMLWVVLANVSGGDWTLQTAEWQEAAARWRDHYFAAVKASGTVSQAQEKA